MLRNISIRNLAVVEDVEESEGGVLYVDLLYAPRKFTVVDERE